MRRSVSIVCAAGSLLVLRAAGASAQNPCAVSKVAIIQGQRILASLPEYLRADSLLTKQEDAYRADIAKQQSTLDSLGAAFRDKSAVLSASVRAVESKKLDDKYQELQAHIDDLRQKAAQERQGKLKPIEDRVQGVIDGLRAELNCSLILDANAQGSGVISIDPAIDLTQRIIDRLKAGGDTAAPPKKP